MDQVQTDITGDDSVYQKVIESLAEVEETNPTELIDHLNEVIDPEALESLFATSQPLGKVIFNYNGHEVSVFSEGYVSVKSPVSHYNR